MTDRRPVLILMAKEPRPGRVKTRLAAGTGSVAAVWWARHQLRRMARRLRDPRWHLVLAVSPDLALGSALLPGGTYRVPQGPGDLGARMGRLLRAAPARPVCIVGSDIPDLSRRHVARAFAALRGADAVFGPAEDGGYWLIGLRRGGTVPATLFRGVRWSTRHALADTEASIPGLRIARVDTLRDVDEAADLQR